MQRYEVMVPGSAKSWSRIENVLFPVGAVMTPAGFVIGFLAAQAGLPIPFSVWMTLVCVGSIMFFLGRVSMFSYLANKGERRAGYTTIPFPHDPDVDLVEPKTGIVVRAAGATALTKEEYENAVRRARAEYVA